jgi:hypothetical protein
MAAWQGRTRRVARTLPLFAVLLICWPATPAGADPVIAAAGDVACSTASANYNGGNGTSDACRQKYTSNLLVNAGLSAVLVLGDSQYDTAKLSQYTAVYGPTWGRVKPITYPAPGNHEYKSTGAVGYFDYFNGVGVQTGQAGDRSKGYYSFDIGTWHLIALNSNDMCMIIACGAGSSQEQWLKADLAAHPNYCTLAYWHHPSFNSGYNGNLTAMQTILQDLYNANADVILGGHAHDYERFAPQNPSGQLDSARGIRQFVVGTGGAFFTSIGTAKPNSQVRQNSTYGVLELTLHPTSYDWQFVPEAGKKFTDSGSTACHGTTTSPDTTKPTAPGALTASAKAPNEIDLNWLPSTDNVGVTGYNVYRDGTLLQALGTATSYADTTVAPGTTHDYQVRAVDAAGNLSDPSNTASATTPASQTVLTFSPDADAPVKQANPTTNYATSSLGADFSTSTSNIESFLRFTVSGVSSGPVLSAKLRLHSTSDATTNGPAIYTSGTSWGETTINWNNRPAPTSAATDDKGAIPSNTWVEYDVTPFVTGDGTYSFRLATDSTDGVYFSSREASTYQPELVLTLP